MIAINWEVSRQIMKWLKRIGIGFLFLPVFLIAFWVLYEIFGMCVNHIATKQQTEQLQAHLEQEIPDIEIINVYSETGNTTGTGNHADCLSSIIFSTQMQVPKLQEQLSKYYTFDDWSCCINTTEDGCYLFYLNTSAPFADNIEGH